MNEPWRSLRVGDRIRIVRIPDEFLNSGNMFPDETRKLYEHLIACRAILTVEEICDFDTPWIGYEQKMEDGTTMLHSLAVNDDSWELFDDK